MPPSNLVFQIGCYRTGSRTTMPPSADTRTFTGSVVRPMRTFGPEGARRTGPEGGAEDCGRAARPEAARAPATIAEATSRIVKARCLGVIEPGSLTCSRTSPARPLPRPSTGEAKEFGPQRGARSEGAGVSRGDDSRLLLPRPADGHAQVLRLHRAGGAERPERPRQRLHDLPRQPFLKLQAPRQRVHGPGDLRQADKAIARHVGDVGRAAGRQQVVHAHRGEP